MKVSFSFCKPFFPQEMSAEEDWWIYLVRLYLMEWMVACELFRSPAGKRWCLRHSSATTTSWCFCKVWLLVASSLLSSGIHVFLEHYLILIRSWVWEPTIFVAPLFVGCCHSEINILPFHVDSYRFLAAKLVSFSFMFIILIVRVLSLNC